MRLKYLFILALSWHSACQDVKPFVQFPSYFPQENRIYLDSVRKETVVLGEKLFFDPRLSKNDKISCATCHLPELAFTDGKKISQGFEGRFSKHNSSTLLNIGFLRSFMFDKGSHNIEIQPIIPLLDTNEMNMSLDALDEKFKQDATYQMMSMETYGRPLNRRTITLALAAYMKSLLACTSRYDSFVSSGDSSILSSSERRGMGLFFEKAQCNQCHIAPLFTDSEHYNLGLEDSRKGRLGVFANTLVLADRGRFKTPTLRNIEITFPYFHDGRVDNLEQAIAYHHSPQRNTSDFIPVSLTKDEIQDLSAFLKTLTDKRYKKKSH